MCIYIYIYYTYIYIYTYRHGVAEVRGAPALLAEAPEERLYDIRLCIILLHSINIILHYISIILHYVNVILHSIL